MLSQLQDGVNDIQDVMHTVLRQNLLVAFFGENPSFCAPEMHHFHSTVDYFVDRYSQPCHSQDVTTQDEKALDEILQASHAMVNAFRRAAPSSLSALRSPAWES